MGMVGNREGGELGWWQRVRVKGGWEELGRETEGEDWLGKVWEMRLWFGHFGLNVCFTLCNSIEV